MYVILDLEHTRPQIQAERSAYDNVCHFTACKNRQTDGYKFGWGKEVLHMMRTISGTSGFHYCYSYRYYLFVFFLFFSGFSRLIRGSKPRLGGRGGGGSGIAERIPVQPNPGGSRGEGGGRIKG